MTTVFVARPVVTVTPKHHAEFNLALSGAPSFSAVRGFGYEQATIPCELDDQQRESMLGATVNIHGTGWRGIVVRRPDVGEPLLVSGWGWCMKTGRRLADYCVKDLGRWKERTHYNRAPDWGLSTSDDVLSINVPRHIIGTPDAHEWKIRQHSGVAPSSWVLRNYRGDLLIYISQHTVLAAGEVHGFLYDYGANQSATKFEAAFVHNCGSYGTIRVYSGVENSDYSNNEPITWTLEGTIPTSAGSIVQSITRTHRYVMVNFELSGGWVMGGVAYVRFTGVKAYRAVSEVNGFVFDFGAENIKTTSTIKAALSHNAGVNATLRIFSGVRNTDFSQNEPVTWTPEGSYATGAINKTISRTHRYILLNWELTQGWDMAADGWMRLADVRVYGMGFSNITASSVITDVMLNEIGNEYFPVPATQWIQDDSTVIEPLEFGKTDAATKVAEIQKYSAYDFGWYTEMGVDGPLVMPHWAPWSTKPDYVLKLSECESYDLDESTLDELASGVNIKFTYPSGERGSAEYTDTDPSHPLVQLGIERFEDVDVQGYTNTSTIADRFFNERGRRQVKGSATTRKLLTAAGATADPYTVRPMQMVRVLGLQGGAIDCLIHRVTWHGDVMTLELDNEGYRLDSMLARIAKRR